MFVQQAITFFSLYPSSTLFVHTYGCTCVYLFFFFLYILSPTCDGSEQVELKRHTEREEKKHEKKVLEKRLLKKKFMMKKGRKTSCAEHAYVVV